MGGGWDWGCSHSLDVRLVPDGANGFGAVCPAVPQLPKPEVCDGLDNDCDGAALSRSRRVVSTGDHSRRPWPVPPGQGADRAGLEIIGNDAVDVARHPLFAMNDQCVRTDIFDLHTSANKEPADILHVGLRSSEIDARFTGQKRCCHQHVFGQLQS